MKLAPEGYPFIIVFAVATAVAYTAFGLLPAVVPFFLTLFMVSFFRDPERLVPDAPDLFVSPADGKVIVVRETHEGKYLHADVKQISIFMSPLNVHVNRVPCDGTVKSVVHNRGRFLAAYKDDASVKNENIEMVMSTAYGDVLIRQVAGFVARRAVCRKIAGDVMRRGERYGMIKFSSRVDVYLPATAAVSVKPGDVVKAGETVLARL